MTECKDTTPQKAKKYLDKLYEEKRARKIGAIVIQSADGTFNESEPLESALWR